mgnify:CR=1 FL=1|tara:strand:+ start:2318 stop:2701 length:384 start_codon:yes stop_codon:yes gene_type:complete
MYKSGQIVKTIAYQVLDVPVMYHFGVIWVDEVTDEVFVLHNSGEGFTLKESFDEFILDREFVELQESKLEYLTNEELLKRFEKCEGKFDALDYNCEHFVDCMLGDKKKSEQIRIYVLAAIALFIIFK